MPKRYMQTRWLKPAFTMLKREKERERERQVHLPSIILAHINLVFKKYNNNREKERKKIPFSVLRNCKTCMYLYR